MENYVLKKRRMPNPDQKKVHPSQPATISHHQGRMQIDGHQKINLLLPKKRIWPESNKNLSYRI